MNRMTIAISDDQLVQLQEKAAKLGVTPKELVQASIGDLLTRSEDEFQDAAA